MRRSFNAQKTNVTILLCFHGHSFDFHTFNHCHDEYFMNYTPPNLCPIDLLHSINTNVFSIRLENSVDPDELASLEAS